MALSAPVAGRYAQLVLSLTPQSLPGSSADGVPDLMNVVRFPSAAALAQMEAEAQFRAMLPLREASVELVCLAGPGRRPGLPAEATGRERYLVDVARFGPGGEAAYRRHERAVAAALAPYGYRVRLKSGRTPSRALPVTGRIW